MQVWGLRARVTARALAATPSTRRGVIIVLAALMLILVFGLTAFVVDFGYMSVTATELQNVADGAALAAILRFRDGFDAMVAEAQANAGSNRVAGRAGTIRAADVELGTWNATTRTFTPNIPQANAVRVTARLNNQATFFGRIFNRNSYSQSRQAVAILNPRDIAFVVDLSGSMNDDTEPVWASDLINAKFGPQGYPSIGNQLMQTLYNDLSFGTYPGAEETIGQTLGVPEWEWYAYAIMTMDNGPLTNPALPTQYRISNTDNERTRKRAAYNWIIDHQMSRLMPNARPRPSSTDSSNFPHWEKYLDYIIAPTWVGSWEDPPPGGGDDGGGGDNGGGGDPGPPPPPSPPSGSLDLLRFREFALRKQRLREQPRDLGRIAGFGTAATVEMMLLPPLLGPSTPGLPRRGSTDGVDLPPDQDEDRIYCFNNPNQSLHPGADGGLGWSGCNRVGYRTYTQFLMDWGRDRSPRHDNNNNVRQAGWNKTQLSVESPHCLYHSESTAAGAFNFPASEQPMHAVRRALIAALKEVEDRNVGLSAGGADQVSIITYDALDQDHQPEVRVALTRNYRTVMTSCTTLQATSDIGNTTATEAGLELARRHIAPPSDGGIGRTYSTKVIVLCSDGVPNAWQSTPSSVNSFVAANPNGDYYSSDYIWYNAALSSTAKATQKRMKTYAVGMGLGADLDFMDRVARIGRTAEGGMSPRGTGNPADYEARLTEIFRQIINTRGGRLVK